MDVAHQTLVLGTLHGRTLEECTILLYGELFPIGWTHAEQGPTRLQQRFIGGQAVQVRASPKAAVATVEHVSHLLTRPFWQFATMLNGEITQAFA